MHQFAPDRRFERIRTGTDESGTVEPGAQTHNVRGHRQNGFEFGTHVVDLPFDGVSGYGTFGPAFWHHCAQPNIGRGEQEVFRLRARWRLAWPESAANQHVAVQNKMCGGSYFIASEHSLELAPRFQSMHRKTRISPALPQMSDATDSHRQALAALGAARIDNSTTTTCFHANQEAMGAGPANFGGLVRAFHLRILEGSGSG